MSGFYDLLQDLQSKAIPTKRPLSYQPLHEILLETSCTTKRGKYADSVAILQKRNEKKKTVATSNDTKSKTDEKSNDNGSTNKTKSDEAEKEILKEEKNKVDEEAEKEIMEEKSTEDNIDTEDKNKKPTSEDATDNNNNNNTVLETIQQYQVLLERYRDDNQKTTKSSSSSNDNTVRSIQELRNVYLYGLETISKLKDLQDSPDAIMPGNFASTYIQEDEEVKEDSSKKPPVGIKETGEINKKKTS